MRYALAVLTLLLLACTNPSPADAWQGDFRAASGPYRLEVTNAWGGHLPTFEQGGRTYVMGEVGQRYRIRIRNQSNRRIEAVVSVDGRDAIDGRPASWSKPGYVIGPWGEVTVDGFRVSMADVATFRFSSVRDSYAARTGSARNVGVVGVAIFNERPRPQPRPRPYYRPPTDDRWEDEDDYGARGGGSTAEKSRPAPPAAAEAPAAKGEARQDRAESAAPPERRQARTKRPSDRPGLGTEFGERRESRAYHVEFVRQRPHHPDVVLGLRYNDREGLLALGIELEPRRPDRREIWKRETARPFEDMPRSFAAPPPGWE